MKILCFSDSHGNPYYMKKAINANRDADAVFFLGDGLSDIESIMLDYPDKAFYTVKGNCDFGHGLVRKTETLEIGGARIVLTHGDLYGAKYGTAGLERLALQTGADIVVFGHTHNPETIYFREKESAAEDSPSAAKAFYLFNPGSIGEGTSLSFGIITLGSGAPLFSHGHYL